MKGYRVRLIPGLRSGAGLIKGFLRSRSHVRKGNRRKKRAVSSGTMGGGNRGRGVATRKDQFCFNMWIQKTKREGTYPEICQLRKGR